MFKKEEIDTILMRYLLNESSSEEREMVSRWIAENPENQLYFDRIERLHRQMQRLVQSEAIRCEYSVLRFKMRRNSWWRRLPGIAACVFLFLGIGTGLYLYNYSGEPESVVVVSSAIPPGESRAILHLSSGETVDLRADNRRLQEKDGTWIQVSEKGSMNYSVSPKAASSEEVFNRLEIPRGGEFNLVLSDGTEVWLNSGTELRYPTSFTARERTVRLKGEAYFKVAKNANVPFIVIVNDMKVRVYGTEFNINTQNAGEVQTVLVHGSVGITCDGKETMLMPSQKAVFSEKTRDVTVEDVNVLPYIAWKSGNFVFIDEPLEMIMNKLCNWYDIEVFYVREDDKVIRFSGVLERYKDVNELFRYFEKISDIRFVVEGNTVIVK